MLQVCLMRDKDKEPLVLQPLRHELAVVGLSEDQWGPHGGAEAGPEALGHDSNDLEDRFADHHVQGVCVTLIHKHARILCGFPDIAMDGTYVIQDFEEVYNLVKV